MPRIHITKFGYLSIRAGVILSLTIGSVRRKPFSRGTDKLLPELLSQHNVNKDSFVKCNGESAIRIVALRQDRFYWLHWRV
jgi:hypothetical protein